jgi:hypothetical protein
LKSNKFKKVLSKKKSYKPIYLTDGVVIDSKKEKLDIILSPKYYLIKREDITIPKEKDALKIAPSIFESFFDSLEDIKFLAIKEEKSYLFIALNIKHILETLQNDYGITEKRIGNIYTIQTEISEIENSLKVDEKKSLILLDGIVSEFKNSGNSQTVSEYLKMKTRSNYSIKFKGVRDVENGSVSFLYLSLIPIFLSISLGFDFWKVSQAKKELEAKIENANSLYKLPKTSFQRDSIKKRFEKIEEEQSKIRDNISWLKDERFHKFGKLKRVISSKDSFSFQIEIKDRKYVKEFSEKVQKRDRNANIFEKENLLEVKF